MATGAEVASWSRAVGWTGDDLVTAIAVAKAESSWNAAAVNRANRNGSIDYGLFQINSIHNPTEQEKTDGPANARRAYQIWRASGWRAWSAYNSGSYKQYLVEARGLADAIDVSSINTSIQSRTNSDASIDIPLPSLPTFANPLDSIGSAAKAFIANIQVWISNSLLGIAGIVFIVAGLSLLARQRVEYVARMAAKAL